jgi:hypothetical protein
MPVFAVFKGEAVVLKDEDAATADEFVDEAAAIQANYSKSQVHRRPTRRRRRRSQ